MTEDMKKDVLEVNLTKKGIVLQGENGDEGQVKISKELRRKIVDENGRVGEIEDLTVNMQNEDASISLTKGTTRNTTFNVVDSVPTFKITFEEKTEISLSPNDLRHSLQQAASTSSLDTSSSDVGIASGENVAKSPSTKDKKALTGHILHEISEVLDKIDLSYINKVRSEFKKQLNSKKSDSGKIKNDKLINPCSERKTAVGRSVGECEVTSSEDKEAKEDRVTKRDKDTSSPIKRKETVLCRTITNVTNVPPKRNKYVLSSAPGKERCPMRDDKHQTGNARDKVSFLDILFAAIATFTPRFQILARASPADVDSASAFSADTLLDDGDDDDDYSSVSYSDLDTDTQSEGSSRSSSADLELNDQHSPGRVNEIKEAAEDKLGIRTRNYPIALYCLCFALFYLLWTMCYMSCTYRRTFFGVARNSNTWYCKVYYSFSKLSRFKPDTTRMVTYKNNRKDYHPFQPW